MYQVKNNVLAGTVSLLCLGLTAAPIASAQSSGGSSEVTLALIDLLVREGVIPLEKARELMARAEQEASLARQQQAAPAEGTVRVPYIPQAVKNEMREELRQEIVAQAKEERWGVPDSLPAWIDRIEWGGDLRARYQGDFFDSGNFPFFPDVQAINDAGGVNTADGFPLVNSTQDRNRLRYRARLDLDARVASRVRAGFRLAAGNDNGPVSTNNTFGDYLGKDAIWIDHAYIEAEPFSGITFTAGRMPNPFVATDLVWDRDLNPEGVRLTGRHAFGIPAAPEIFLTAGAFPLVERTLFDDEWLYAGQLGGRLSFGQSVGLMLAGAYYDFQGVQSQRNPPDGSRLTDYSRPPMLGQGNSVFNMRTDGLTTLAGLASDFRLLNVTGQLDVRFGRSLVGRLTADYVKNTAMDPEEIDALRGEPGVPPGDTGWMVKLTLGTERMDQRHDWLFSVGYRYLETDAVLDVFTDSDFGAYGGTDLKGYVVESGYAFTDNTWLSLRLMSADSIDRPPFSTDVVMVDFNTQF